MVPVISRERKALGLPSVLSHQVLDIFPTYLSQGVSKRLTFLVLFVMDLLQVPASSVGRWEAQMIQVSGTARDLKAASPRYHAAGKVTGPQQRQTDRRWLRGTDRHIM